MKFQYSFKVHKSAISTGTNLISEIPGLVKIKSENNTLWFYFPWEDNPVWKYVTNTEIVDDWNTVSLVGDGVKITLSVNGHAHTIVDSSNTLTFTEYSGFSSSNSIVLAQSFPEVNQQGPTIYSLTAAEWLHKPGDDTVAPLLWNFGYTYTQVNKIAPNAPLAQLTLYSMSLTNTLVSTPNAFNVKIIPLVSTSIGSDYYTGSFLGLAAGTLTFTDNEYVFKSVALPYVLHINKHTGVVSVPEEEHIYVTIMPGYSSYGSCNTPIYSNPATGFYIFCSGYHRDNYKIGTVYYTSYSLDKDKYIFGYQKQKNGATAYYLPMISHAVLDTGAYDVATTTVPLPEDPTN